MSASLFDFTIASYLQALRAVEKTLKKGQAFCDENNIALDDIVSTKLAPDMLPFHFQVISVVHHSMGAMKGLEAGEFRPPRGYPDTDYAGLQNLISEAIEALEGYTEHQVNAWSENQMKFVLGDKILPFTASNFVLSFSLPNLYFHAATIYDILRMKGVPLGKKDFLGHLRMDR